MAGNCSIEDCYPDDTGCNHEGCSKLTDCKFYKKSEGNGSSDKKTEEDSFAPIPWTGNTLGLKDLNYLASFSPIILVGITGVASAGKTTFLATLYCLLRHGLKIGDYQFSGSLTLTGWENIAWYLSWKQHNDIHFPPHTSSNAGRIPGLLHLSLRNKFGEKKEFVFTDAPGEWFDYWNSNTQHPNAKGAAWIHKHADAFLLFADCEMLTGSQIGKARQQTRQVADRLKYKLNGRPLGLIWSKSDIVVDTDVKQQISNHIQNSYIEHYQEFETSVFEGDAQKFHANILKSIHWILETISATQNRLQELPLYAPNDLFLSKR